MTKKEKISWGTVLVVLPSFIVGLIELSKEAREWFTIVRKSEPSAVIDTVYIPNPDALPVKSIKEKPSKR